MEAHSSPELHSLAFELQTDDPHELLDFLLQATTVDDIQRVRLEIEAASPISLTNEFSVATETELDVVQNGDAGDSNGTTVSKKDGDTDPTDDTAEQNEVAPAVRFNENSTMKTIAEVLAKHSDEFLTLDQIQQHTPSDAGIPDGQFSTILWSLADRGLVEKKQRQDDKRKRKYKITSKGVASVKEVK